MTVAEFYDTWGARMLEDHRTRNPRVVAALELAARTLTPGRLLDVGCGIGWTSAELTEMGHTVTGIDLSPRLIETANQIFSDHCEFRCHDFTVACLPTWDRFDSLTMIDVYEHLPAATRSRVYANLAQLLRPGGRLLLTAPTAELQREARSRGIEMQPIEEDLTATDLEQLASNIGAKIVLQERVPSLSSCGDYWHFVCERERW